MTQDPQEHIWAMLSFGDVVKAFDHV